MADQNRSYSGASHFASSSNFEVQRSNHFEILINLNALELGDEGTNVLQALGERQGDSVLSSASLETAFRLCCTTANVPNINIQSIDLKHGNETVKVAGAPSYDDINVSVYDTIGFDMSRMLLKWFYKVFDPTTHTMGLVTQYKTTANLFLYDPTGKTYRQWICYGVFPKSLQFGDYSADGGGQAISVRMTLSVDKAEYVEVGGKSKFDRFGDMAQ